MSFTPVSGNAMASNANTSLVLDNASQVTDTQKPTEWDYYEKMDAERNETQKKKDAAYKVQYRQWGKLEADLEKEIFAPNKEGGKLCQNVADVCFRGKLADNLGKLIVQYAHFFCFSVRYKACLSENNSVRDCAYRRLIDVASIHRDYNYSAKLDQYVEWVNKSKARYSKTDEARSRTKTAASKMDASQKCDILFSELPKQMILRYAGLPPVGENEYWVLQLKAEITRCLKPSALSSLVKDVCGHTLADALYDPDELAILAQGKQREIESLLDQIGVSRDKYMKEGNLANYKVEPEAQVEPVSAADTQVAQATQQASTNVQAQSVAAEHETLPELPDEWDSEQHKITWWENYRKIKTRLEIKYNLEQRARALAQNQTNNVS